MGKIAKMDVARKSIGNGYPFIHTYPKTKWITMVNHCSALPTNIQLTSICRKVDFYIVSEFFPE
jgi:hypothetical protein